MASGFRLNGGTTGSLLGARVASMPPIPVFIGPGKSGGKTDVAAGPAAKRGKGKLAAARTPPANSANAGATPAATAPTTGGGLGPTILPANGFSPPAPGGALAFTNPPPDGAAAAPGAVPLAEVPLPRARPKRHRQTAKQ